MAGIIFGLSVLSAIFYRMGGAKGYSKLWRRVGCTVCGLIAMISVYCTSFLNTGCFGMFAATSAIIIPWWLHLISAGLLYAALTSYCDEIFGYDNFWVTGCLYGLAYIGYGFYSGAWEQFILRTLILSVGIGGLHRVFHGSKRVKIKHSDVVEELARGALLIGTVPILMWR